MKILERKYNAFASFVIPWVQPSSTSSSFCCVLSWYYADALFMLNDYKKLLLKNEYTYIEAGQREEAKQWYPFFSTFFSLFILGSRAFSTEYLACPRWNSPTHLNVQDRHSPTQIDRPVQHGSSSCSRLIERFWQNAFCFIDSIHSLQSHAHIL